MNGDDRKPELQAVGVTAAEESVYRLLLEQPGVSASEAAERMPELSARKIAVIAKQLEQRGLANRMAGQRDRFVPAPPGVAIEALILRSQEQLERTRLVAQRMEADYRSSRHATPRGPLDVVEVVLGRVAVGQRFEQIVAGAHERILVFDRPPYATDPTTVDPIELRVLARGVKNRTIYDPEALTIPGRIDHLRTVAEAGEQARTLSGIPMKLFIADDRVAFIPLSLDEPGMEGALLVQPSPVLDALTTLFESLWERAVPIDFSAQWPPSSDVGSVQPSQSDLELVLLLRSGLKDRAIARQMGVAERTVLRRVARLMDSLGARTRFQAGWLAARMERDAQDEP